MENQSINIPILYGSLSDLTKLDLRFINSRVVLYKGSIFRAEMKKLLHPLDYKRSYNFATIETEDAGIYSIEDCKFYAIVPVDSTKPFVDEDIYHVYQLILSIFPSDLSIVKIIRLTSLGKHFQCSGITNNPFKSTGEGHYDNFLYIHKTEYGYLRKFLSRNFDSSKDLKYVKYILSVYTNSRFEYNPIYQFISLMICLEVVVEGKEQLTYKLKRNVAILCGNDVTSCRLIYKNIDQLYKLRSAIVHGEIKPSYKNFKEYHQYLIKLVAKLIRELITHNISSISSLNTILTEIGYSQNHLISAGYTSSKYPFMDNVELSYRAIQKY